MSAAKRLTKHQLKEDKFVDTMLGYADKIRENQNLLIGGLVVVVVLILGLNWTLNARKAGHAEAQMAFSAALRDMQTAMTDEAQDSYEQPLAAFEAIRADYGGKDVGRWAVYYVGYCQEQLGDFLDAEETYNEYQAADPDGEFAVAARLGIASCNGAVGRYKRQADFLVELAATDGVEKSQADAWLYQAGQIYMDNGYFDDARDVLVSIQDRVDAPTQRLIEQDLQALAALKG